MITKRGDHVHHVRGHHDRRGHRDPCHGHHDRRGRRDPSHGHHDSRGRSDRRGRRERSLKDILISLDSK